MKRTEFRSEKRTAEKRAEYRTKVRTENRTLLTVKRQPSGTAFSSTSISLPLKATEKSRGGEAIISPYPTIVRQAVDNYLKDQGDKP